MSEIIVDRKRKLKLKLKTNIKKYRNSQKPLTRKRASAKRNPLGKKKETRCHSIVTGKVTTHNLSCCWWEAQCLWAALWLTFPLVAAISFTNDPWLKTPNNGLIKITTKTLYNGLNNYNWKPQIMDISAQKG